MTFLIPSYPRMRVSSQRPLMDTRIRGYDG